MAKTNKKKSEASWYKELNEVAVSEALDEATVDAKDESEQHSGLFYAIAEEMQFPFAAKVLGEDVKVVSAEWPENDDFGIDLVCERNGQQHRIEARSVELVSPLPDGHLFLAAYLDWKQRM